MARSDDPDRPAGDAAQPRRPLRPHLDPLAVRGRMLREARTALDRWGGGRGPEQRFEEQVALDPALGGRPEDAVTLQELATAPVRGVGRIVYSSNAAFVIELDAADPVRPDRPLRAVYKPTRGERPLWDFPHRTLHLREVATYLVDAALGTALVPATVLRDGPVGPGSMQLFVDVAGRALSSSEERRLRPVLHDVAALDVLINNADRKSAHLLVDERGRLHGIDHGLTFLPYPRQRTVLIELGGSDLPAATAGAVRRLDGDAEARDALVQRLRGLLDPVEVDAFSQRLAELAADPRYPVLDPWEGRPFEWW